MRTPFRAGCCALLAIAAATAVVTAARAPEPRPAPPRVVDSRYPAYERAADVSGRVVVSVPTAAADVLRQCIVPFRELYSGVTVDVVLPADASRPVAEQLEKADLVVALHRLTDQERRAIEQRDGRAPTEVQVGAAALAVFVFRDNPIAGLTLAQIDGLFSRTTRRGGPAITRWGEAGLGGVWSDQAVIPFGAGPQSSSAALFREVVLQGGEFGTAIRWQHGSSSAVQGPGAETGGVAFAPPSYATPRTRAVPLSDGGSNFVAPAQERCLDGTYPLCRPLNVVARRRADAPLAAAARELLVFLCSRQGQEILEQNDAVPLTDALSRRQIEIARR